MISPRVVAGDTVVVVVVVVVVAVVVVAVVVVAVVVVAAGGDLLCQGLSQHVVLTMPIPKEEHEVEGYREGRRD